MTDVEVEVEEPQMGDRKENGKKEVNWNDEGYSYTLPSMRTELFVWCRTRRLHTKGRKWSGNERLWKANGKILRSQVVRMHDPLFYKTTLIRLATGAK